MREADKNAKVNALWKLSIPNNETECGAIMSDAHCAGAPRACLQLQSSLSEKQGQLFSSRETVISSMFQHLAIILSEQKCRIIVLLLGYRYFPPNPSYYTLFHNIERPAMSQEITTNSSKLFFYLLIRSKQLVITNGRLVTVVCYNQLYLRFEAPGLSFHLPKGRC